MDNEYLCFIKLIGKDIEDLYTYEFLFTKDPSVVWGEDFEQYPAGLCNDLVPNEEDYDLVKTIRTTINLDLIQNSSCFGMQDAMDGIIALRI